MFLMILKDNKKPSVEYSYKTDSDWSSGEIESTSEEISLRATGMRHSLMPLTDDRQHINMRGRRYTAPPLTSMCSVVCQSYKEDNNRRKEAKKTKVAEEPRFHNRIGVFRRKTGYKYVKNQ